MKTLIILSLLILVTGCIDQIAWEHPGDKTEADLRKDKYECKYQAIALRMDALNARHMFTECMEARGYHKEGELY